MEQVELEIAVKLIDQLKDLREIIDKKTISFGYYGKGALSPRLINNRVNYKILNVIKDEIKLIEQEIKEL